MATIAIRLSLKAWIFQCRIVKLVVGMHVYRRSRPTTLEAGGRRPTIPPSDDQQVHFCPDRRDVNIESVCEPLMPSTRAANFVCSVDTQRTEFVETSNLSSVYTPTPVNGESMLDCTHVEPAIDTLPGCVCPCERADCEPCKQCRKLVTGSHVRAVVTMSQRRAETGNDIRTGSGTARATDSRASGNRTGPS